MKLVWTKAAVRDLIHLRRHIAQDNPEAARIMARRILDAVSSLPRHPQMGRVGRLAGTREIVVTHTPYLVPYRIRPKAIELLRVLHGRQQWPSSGRARHHPTATR